MAKKRNQTEAAKFLNASSEEGASEHDVSESEGEATEAGESPAQEASQEKPVTQEAKSSEVPGKYRKFH